MRLAKLSEFRRIVYAPGSRPNLKTLRRRIHSIPGGTIEHGHYYVDLDEYDRVKNLRGSIDKRIADLEANPLMRGLV